MADILIVEDDHDLNAAYKLILEAASHHVISAFDGQQALVKLHDFEPDLILLDLLMPVKSGVDFLHDYSDIHKKNPARILVFTNLENSPEIDEAFRLGADKCVIKAWTAPHGLVKVVNDVLQTRPKQSIL
jgi:two-component system response regulator VicR